MKFNSLFRFCPVCGSGSFVQQNVKSLKCEDCGFVWYVNPAAAVAVIIINEKSEMLVCVRAKEPVKGTLDLPGGFIDENETVEEAVVRELKEELGIQLVNTEYLFSLPNDYLYSGWTLPTLDLFFLTRVDENFHPVPADDVADCYFLPFNQINVNEFGLNSVRKAVEKFLTEKRP